MIRIKHISKRWIIYYKTRSAGGPKERMRKRAQRLEEIRLTKTVIVDSLISSWRIGEIKRPDYSVIRDFVLRSHNLPINYILDVKKKCWPEDITPRI